MTEVVVRRHRSGFEVVRAMNAQEAVRAQRELFAARLWVYVNVLLSLVLAGFMYLVLAR